MSGDPLLAVTRVRYRAPRFSSARVSNRNGQWIRNRIESNRLDQRLTNNAYRVWLNALSKTLVVIAHQFRGRSKLSTFMKAYRGYARGRGEGLETTVRFFLQNQHLMLITDNKSTFYGTLLGRGKGGLAIEYSVRFHKC